MPAPLADREDIAGEIHAYLDKRFPTLAPVTSDTPLLDGAVDSLGFLELMMFLGEHFGIAIEDEHFDFDNLATPAQLTRFVEQARP